MHQIPAPAPRRLAAGIWRRTLERERGRRQPADRRWPASERAGEPWRSAGRRAAGGGAGGRRLRGGGWDCAEARRAMHSVYSATRGRHFVDPGTGAAAPITGATVALRDASGREVVWRWTRARGQAYELPEQGWADEPWRGGRTQRGGARREAADSTGRTAVGSNRTTDRRDWFRRYAKSRWGRPFI